MIPRFQLLTVAKTAETVAQLRQRLGVKVNASKPPSKEQSSESWSQSPRKWTCLCAAKFPLWARHCASPTLRVKGTKSIKSRQTCTEIADPSPTIPGTWSKHFVTSRGEVQGQGLSSPRWTFPREAKPHFCQNLSKLKSHLDCRLGVGTTNIHPPRCKKNRADAWSGSGVFFAHVWTSQTWSSPKPEITTVTKSPPYLYSIKLHLNFPTANPKTTQLFLRCRVPKSTRPMVGPTPCIKSSSTTREKNKLPPSRV